MRSVARYNRLTCSKIQTIARPRRRLNMPEFSYDHRRCCADQIADGQKIIRGEGGATVDTYMYARTISLTAVFVR